MHLQHQYSDTSISGLGMLLGTEARIMTPAGVDFSFSFYLDQVLILTTAGVQTGAGQAHLRGTAGKCVHEGE